MRKDYAKGRIDGIGNVHPMFRVDDHWWYSNADNARACIREACAEAYRDGQRAADRRAARLVLKNSLVGCSRDFKAITNEILRKKRSAR